jgi:DNA-binding transcriptional MerR regulator
MYDPLSDIHHYGQHLTISQVVKFFAKKEMNITRAMVQNYIRAGLLPPPVNKRVYTHKHLAALVVIDHLKGVFEMSDIKEALAPLMDGEGLPLPAYTALVRSLETISARWRESVAPELPDGGAALLMAHAADLKALALTRMG